MLRHSLSIDVHFQSQSYGFSVFNTLSISSHFIECLAKRGCFPLEVFNCRFKGVVMFEILLSGKIIIQRKQAR